MLRKIITRIIFLMILATVVLLAIARKTETTDFSSSNNTSTESKCESGKRTEFLLLEAIISVISLKNKQ